MQAAALDVAKNSVVLLKNEGQTLPLPGKIKTLAVIGPFANNKNDMLGPWAQLGDSSDVVTVLEGLKKKTAGKVNILYSQGCDAVKIPENFEMNRDKIFSDAVETARKADAVVLVLGETASMSGEAKSRASLDLPGVQEELAKAVKKTGKPVIAVLVNGRPLSVNWLEKNADAIMESWFLGIKEGEAVADILLGDFNPSGKLPVTFPRFVGQVPMNYNHKSTGRPYDPANNYSSGYKDFPNDPLYPFGYGLSYTKFEYGKVKLNAEKISAASSVKVSVSVKNCGEYDGTEVVQLYLRDVAGSVTRPVKELKNFKKVFLKKGEAKEIEFEIAEKDLRFYDKDMKFASEPGQFKVYVGTNSRDVQEASFELQ
jgi:beta-glucosidase